MAHAIRPKGRSQLPLFFLRLAAHHIATDDRTVADLLAGHTPEGDEEGEAADNAEEDCENWLSHWIDPVTSEV